MLKPTKILVPTDFSEYSDRALKQALDIAKHYNAKVFLLHVVHGEGYFSTADFAISTEMMQKINNAAFARAQDSLDKQLYGFPQAQEIEEVEVVTNIRQGVPYEEILKEAKEQEIDLIVIASLGRSGISKYLIGSVSRNVLKGAKCPVLLTK
jgi:nucleotide-binding universal stress UspA family protein